MTTQPPREPTMEEILSSIRRIISEEGQGGAGGNKQPPSPASSPVAVDSPPSLPMGEKKAPPATPSDAPVLELTELVTDANPVEEREAPAAALAVPVEPEVAPFEEVKASEEQPVAEPLPALEPLVLAGEPESEPEPEPVPPAAVETSEANEALLAAPVEAAVAGTLASLVRDLREEQQGKADAGPVSPLEALVLEALRPALKSWLDQNLAPLVEQIVRDEVRRLSRRVTDA